MKLKAPAKVNLTLEVLGKRADGYHEIRSIFQTLELYDELELEASHKLEFTCDREELDSPDNLAVKAFQVLKEKTSYKPGARIKLKKSIPVSAGLGGGSSDAAAVLKGLNRLWGLGLPRDELTRIAAEIGSDVPFFIHGGTALVKGRGEIISPLKPVRECWLVLLIPPVESYANKTSLMYRGLEKADFTRGEFTRALAKKIEGGDEIEPLMLYNVFDGVAPKIWPQLAFFQERLVELSGVEKAHLAGSGPGLYVILKDEEKAKYAWRRLKEMFKESYLTRCAPINRGGHRL